MKKEFTTPDLPYAYDALEPYIDKETMTIHHDKHHMTYTTKFNNALEGNEELFDKSAEDILKNIKDIPEDIRVAVINNGGGHVNHALFWQIMGPDGEGKPEGDLMSHIKKDFGSFEKFKEEFETAATTQFGSGWAWLVKDGDKLIVEKTSNQDSPLSEGRTPILALDVWEHAYYLKYQNVRPDYIKVFWKIVNWKKVSELYNN
ncbi:MAG: superoxide dismutase [Bacteroidota bacterium]|nr:superoxide dismutase [Bacteroidota bacterium]